MKVDLWKGDFLDGKLLVQHEWAHPSKLNFVLDDLHGYVCRGDLTVDISRVDVDVTLILDIIEGYYLHKLVEFKNANPQSISVH